MTHAYASPLPAGSSVQSARDSYLAENGFTVEGYEARWTDASFLGVRFRVPNTPHHAWGIRLHDLHHVVTGYGTDLVGEGEVSAWEAARGLRGLGLYLSALVVTGALTGLLFSPRRIARAWRASRGQEASSRGPRTSLFQSERSYEELMAMSVGELRRELGVAEGGVAQHPRGRHAFAPAVA